MIIFRLSKILEDFGMTQKELSEKTGIRPATISYMCNGKTKLLSINNLDIICEELDCSIEDIIEYIPNEEYDKYFKN